MAYSNAPQYSTYQQKRVAFYGDMDSRQDIYSPDTDQIYENVYCEAVINQYTGGKDLYLRKRPGLTSVATLGGGAGVAVRGVFSWESYVYYVQSATVYRWEPGVGNTTLGTIGSTSGPVGMCMLPYQGDNGLLYLVVSDGTGLWWNKITTDTLDAVPGSAYPTPHIPQPIAMDGYLVLAKAGTDELWNSQLSNIASTWDFISTEMYPDHVHGLNRYNNYIMVEGSDSIEMFYNAAFDSGSPFARNESTVITLGCTALWAAVQVDTTFYWVGITREGGRSVWMMDDFESKEIGTPFIKRCLSEESDVSTIRATTVRSKGRHWYVVYMTNHTFAYDIDEKKWAVWTYNGQRFPMDMVADANTGVAYMLYDGILYAFDPASGDDAGVPILCRWQTNLLDFETMNRKFHHRLTLVGNKINVDAIDVYWTDDDYSTWNGPRQIPLDNSRPAIVNLGYFRQRGFRFEYSGISDLRLQGMELQLNIGAN